MNSEREMGDQVGDEVDPEDGSLSRYPFAMPGRNHAADHVVLDARIGARIEAARRAALIAAANKEK